MRRRGGVHGGNNLLVLETCKAAATSTTLVRLSVLHDLNICLTSLEKCVESEQGGKSVYYC